MDKAITDTGSMDSQIVELPTFADLTSLSSEKLQQLVSTLAFILTLPAARDTYAQTHRWKTHLAIIRKKPWILRRSYGY